jgi:RNA polymerase sigma-70 factor (ECF subfamily)
VAGILAGDEQCFEALYARYRGCIYGFALKRLRDPIESEDVTQEVFLQVHRCLGSYQGRSTLQTWLFGIAYNRVCRRFRKQQPSMISIDENEVVQLVADECPADRRVDAVRLLRRCGEVVETELSPAQRKVFYLAFDENRSTRSIADHLGKSRQAVKISLFRSRKTLNFHTSDEPVAAN